MRSANDTAEYRASYTSKEYINNLYALDHGWDGRGVEVAVIDGGVDTDHTHEFDGQIDYDKSKDFGEITKADGTVVARNDLGDEHSDHGTPVASIIAAAEDGKGIEGVAPGAKLIVLRVDDWNEMTQTQSYMHLVQALYYAADEKVKIVSASLVGSGANLSMQGAVNNLATTKGLFIQSAGNDGVSSPAEAVNLTDLNRDSWLFVGALEPNGTSYQLASYSNKAGSAADRYVVAPGTNMAVNIDGSISPFSGTSSAAPVVAGLAALIGSKWPQLDGQTIGDVILTTAKDIGAPGIDPVFGHGLVDAETALAPVNPTISNDSGSKPVSVDASVMVVPGPVGTASIAAALSDVTMLDQFGRDYHGSLADLVVKPETRDGHWLRRRIAELGAGDSVSLNMPGFTGNLGFASERVGPAETDIRSAPTAGSVELVSGGFGIRAGWNTQDSLQSDIMGLAPFADGVLAYAPQAGQNFGVDRYTADGKFSLTMAIGHEYGTDASGVTLGWSRGRTDLRLSYIDETGSVMGMPTGEGALRLGRGARTAMIEAHQSVAVAFGWSFEGYGSLGITKLKVDPSSLVTGSTPIIGSRVGLQASGPVARGVLSFGVAQPLAVEAGAAKLTYGTSYDLAARSLVYSTTQASLAGERRLQLTAGYARGGPHPSIRIGLMQDMTDSSTSVLIGLSGHF